MTSGKSNKIPTTLGSLLIGAIIGGATIWIATQKQASTFSGVPQASLIEASDVSTDQAETLRKSAYASLSNLQDVLALPGDFAEREAMYALAARASASKLQELIYQLRARSTRLRASRQVGNLHWTAYFEKPGRLWHEPSAAMQYIAIIRR